MKEQSENKASKQRKNSHAIHNNGNTDDQSFRHVDHSDHNNDHEKNLNNKEEHCE